MFLTNKGLFEPQVMYFRLCNLLGIFQRMMNSIFQELLHEGVLANYMDNFVMLWQPLDTQGPMISLTSKPQRRSIMWGFTRELDKEPLLN